VLAIADEIEVRLKREYGLYAASVEGRRQAEWILLDYVDIVIHVFLAEKRAFYDIERLRKSARNLTGIQAEAELQIGAGPEDTGRAHENHPGLRGFGEEEKRIGERRVRRGSESSEEDRKESGQESSSEESSSKEGGEKGRKEGCEIGAGEEDSGEESSGKEGRGQESTSKDGKEGAC
jgi:hypothetical protein